MLAANDLKIARRAVNALQMISIGWDVIFDEGDVTYFRPEIDRILREWTGLDSKAISPNIDKAGHALEMRRLWSWHHEAYRRVVRTAIVKAAQMFWDGIDPDPRLVYNASLTIPVSVSRLQMIATETRFWRERFAPTSKLPEFLFPAHKLTNPLTNPLAKISINSGNRWLADPCLEIFSVPRNSRVCKEWAADKAFELVLSLVNYEDVTYNYEGGG